MFDAVLFDLDGTLIDTTQAILDSLQYTVRYFTGETRDKEQFRKYAGVPLDEVLMDLLPDHIEEARDVYIRHNLSLHDEMVRAFPGTIETLEELRRRGVKLAIVTSKRRPSAMFGLKATGLLGRFDAMVFYDDVTKHKPEPEPILKALELLGIEKGTVLMVGDSTYDIRAARSADARLEDIVVKSAGAAYGPFGREVLSKENPDYILDSIGEVISVLEAESAVQ
ncbi:MAG TPA: HAD-IA family hydrolase [Firmicutes bacterium]|nr:HAD-IA family hydrolase [Candidatus Fermentithermobacillaceae bacterium]